MKSSTIPVLIDRSDYAVFAVAARLVRKARCRQGAADTLTLIQFYLKHHKPEDIAKDFLECAGEMENRRQVNMSSRRKSRLASAKAAARSRLLRHVSISDDNSRN